MSRTLSFILLVIIYFVVSTRIELHAQNSNHKSKTSTPILHAQVAKEDTVQTIIQPTHPGTMNLIRAGIAARVVGAWDISHRYFQEVLRYEPHNTTALYNLGIIAENQHQLDRALFYYQLALATAPTELGFQKAVNSIKQQMQGQCAHTTSCTNSVSTQHSCCPNFMVCTQCNPTSCNVCQHEIPKFGVAQQENPEFSETRNANMKTLFLQQLLHSMPLVGCPVCELLTHH